MNEKKEILKAVHKIVFTKMEQYDLMLKDIIDRFTLIEKRLNEELEYPKEEKKYIIKEIYELHKTISKFLERNKV